MTVASTPAFTDVVPHAGWNLLADVDGSETVLRWFYPQYVANHAPHHQHVYANVWLRVCACVCVCVCMYVCLSAVA